MGIGWKFRKPLRSYLPNPEGSKFLQIRRGPNPDGSKFSQIRRGPNPEGSKSLQNRKDPNLEGSQVYQSGGVASLPIRRGPIFVNPEGYYFVKT